jgi:RES domain-containing protein
MRIFRLHRGHRTAADYGGSLIQPNRWNPVGVPMLYCSTALSLACLEVLVHLGPDQIPPDYVCSAAELATSPEVASFQGNLEDLDATQRFAHSWAKQNQSLALLVPSVIIPIEFNVLLNPVHADFSEIVWSTLNRFRFDPRLLRGTVR